MLITVNLFRRIYFRIGRLCRVLCLSVLFSLFVSPAYAVQAHTGTEGLISHELGHVLFALAMIILLIRMTRAHLSGPGWKQFKVFLWLIICWNILTLSGHWMREGVDAGQFIHQKGQTIGFMVNGVFDLIFYLTRLDHLLLVPAFFMLLLAIRQWGRDSS